VGFIHEGRYGVYVLKGKLLDISAETEAADVVFNVVVTQPIEAVATLGSQARVAVVVTCAVLWVRKLADRGTLELVRRSRRRVGYWQAKSRRFGPYRAPSEPAGFHAWMEVRQET
jgi:hypothetical protein